MSRSMHLRSNGPVLPADDDSASSEMPGEFSSSSSPLSDPPSSLSNNQGATSAPATRRRALSYSDAVRAHMPRDGSATREDVPPKGDDASGTPLEGSDDDQSALLEPSVTAPRSKQMRRNSIASLSSSQAQTVKLAASQLTSAQQEIIDKRNKFISGDNAASVESESEREVSHRDKGKGIDPRNWGNVELQQDEQDAELQAALQESLKTNRRLEKPGEDSGTRFHSEVDGHAVLKAELEALRAENEVLRFRSGSERVERRRKAKLDVKNTIKNRHSDKMLKLRTPDRRVPVPMSEPDSSDSASEIESERDILPSAHIAKNSALGIAFRGLQGRSSPSGSSSSDVSSSEDVSTDIKEPLMIKRSKRHRSKSKKSKKGRRKETKLKPVPPVIYKGEPELIIFQRFVSESISYVQDGNVPRRDEVRIVSRFTDGPAQRFVQRRVFGHWNDWTLESFFRGLFDEVFPTNFTERQCWKLQNFKQREGTSVREYIAELTEVLGSIGYESFRRKRIR